MTQAGRAAFAATLLAAVTVLGAPLYRGALLLPEVSAWDPACRAFAAAAAGTLELLGVAVARDGAVLRHPGGFALEVTGNCTAWLHCVLFLTGLFALRPRLRHGLGAAARGVGLILLVNLTRLVLIFAVGASAPTLFDWSHHVAGEALLAGTVLLLWWRAGAPRTEAPESLSPALRAE